MMYPFLWWSHLILLYFCLELDSNIFSFVISTKYNPFEVHMTGFFKICIIYCKQYRIRKVIWKFILTVAWTEFHLILAL